MLRFRVSVLKVISYLIFSFITQNISSMQYINVRAIIVHHSAIVMRSKSFQVNHQKMLQEIFVMEKNKIAPRSPPPPHYSNHHTSKQSIHTWS